MKARKEIKGKEKEVSRLREERYDLEHAFGIFDNESIDFDRDYFEETIKEKGAEIEELEKQIKLLKKGKEVD